MPAVSLEDDEKMSADTQHTRDHGDTPEHWVVSASRKTGNARRHYPHQDSTPHDPQPLCEFHHDQGGWTAKDPDVLNPSFYPVCKLCEQIQGLTTDAELAQDFIDATKYFVVSQNQDLEEATLHRGKEFYGPDDPVPMCRTFMERGNYHSLHQDHPTDEQTICRACLGYYR